MGFWVKNGHLISGVLMNKDFGFFLEEKGSEEKVEKLRAAHLALHRGKFQEALELAQECLEAYSMDLDAINLAAVSAFNMDDIAMSSALFQKALMFDPGNGGTHHNFGVLLERTGDFAKAVEHFIRCTELQPDFPESFIHIGNVLDLLKRDKEATGYYENALRRLPESPENYFQRGYLFNRLGNFSEALASFGKALEFQPNDPASHNGLGYVLSAMERNREALAYFEKAVELSPQDGTYHFNLGLSLLRLGHFDEAEKSFSKSIEFGPSLVDAVFDNIRLMIDRGPHESLLELLDKAEEVNPGRPDTSLYRGIVFLESGKLLEALKALDESLVRNPDSIQTLNIKGNVLKDLRKLEDALACFDKILKKVGDLPLAHYGRATVLALQGNANDAVKALSEASSRDQQFLNQAWEDPAFDDIRQNPNFLQLIRVKNAT